MFTQGAHARGPRAELDYEKHAAATALGWAVLFATPGQVQDGTALKWVMAVLDARARLHETQTAPPSRAGRT